MNPYHWRIGSDGKLRHSGLALVCASLVAASTVLAPQHGVRLMTSISAGHSCSDMKWTSPVSIIPNEATPKIARFPVLASDSTELLLMGNNIMFYDGRPVPSHALTVWAMRHGDLGQPKGEFTFAYPRGVMREGTLHLLWAEPEASARTHDVYAWPGPLTSVWSASYSHGTGWNEPRRLFTGPLRSGEHMSPSAGNTAAAPIIDFGTSVERDTAYIVTFTLVGHDWSVRLIPVGRSGLYPSVVQVGSTIVAAFVAADEEASHDVNSVFIRRSLDNGRSWEPRLLLSRSGQYPAHDAQLLADENGQLHLIWRRETGNSQSTLRHTMSPDGGRSWTNIQDLLLPAAASSVRAGVDACGKVHVFYLNMAAGPDHARLGHAVWQSTWRRPVAEFPSLDITGLTVHRKLDGTLLIALVGRPSGSSGTAVSYHTFYSILQ